MPGATHTATTLVSAQQRPSLTAEITCAQRAIETMQPAGQRLIDDPYARHFVRRRRFRARMATPSLARLTRRVFDRRYPGYMAIILLRNRYHEDAVAQARADGIDQIVLLGAGYDTTAFRLDFGGATVFEVDAPPTQQAKRRIVTSAGLHPRGAVVYVPCDFEHDELADALALGGFDATRPCLVAWFGVSYFLTQAAVERTLADVAALSASGSRLVWDHMDPAVVDGTTPFVGARRARRIVTKRGEPYRYGIATPDAAALVRSLGFDVLDDARLPELGRRYDAWCRTDDFVGVQTAQRLPERRP